MRAILETDFLHFAAKKRFFVVRSLVVAVPLMFIMFVSVVLTEWVFLADQMGRQVFIWTAYPLLLAAMIVTPAMMAPVLAAERRNNKLDVLLSTPVTVEHVVVGRYLSRLALLGTVFMAALPLVASSLLFGGVSPGEFGRFVLVLSSTLLWTGALAIWASASTKDVASAMRRGFLGVVGILVGLLALSTGLGTRGSAWIVGLTPWGALSGWQRIDAPLGSLALYHACAAAVASIWMVLLAAVSLRRRSRGRSAGPVRAIGRTFAASPGGLLRRPGAFSGSRALLAQDPAVWLELRRGRPRIASRRWVYLIIAVVLLEGYWIAEYFDSYYGWRAQRPELHVYPIVGTFLIAAILVAAHGAATLHRDTEANTLDVLHATPLTNRRLAWAKTVGTLRAGLPFWCLCGLHGVFGVLRGDLNGLTALGCALLALGLLWALAAYSLWVGFRSKSSAQAASRVIGLMVAHVVLTPLLSFCCLRSGSSAAGLFFGHNPPIMVTIPIIIQDQSYMRSEILGSVVLYFIIYVISGTALITQGLPAAYARRREDRPLEPTPWQPPPVSSSSRTQPPPLPLERDEDTNRD